MQKRGNGRRKKQTENDRSDYKKKNTLRAPGGGGICHSREKVCKQSKVIKGERDCLFTKGSHQGQGKLFPEGREKNNNDSREWRRGKKMNVFIGCIRREKEKKWKCIKWNRHAGKKLYFAAFTKGKMTGPVGKNSVGTRTKYSELDPGQIPQSQQRSTN